MSRYELPFPKCDHARRGIVTSGDPKKGAHAATDVCAREACIDDAKAWATATTREPAKYIPDGHLMSERGQAR